MSAPVNRMIRTVAELDLGAQARAGLGPPEPKGYGCRADRSVVEAEDGLRNQWLNARPNDVHRFGV